MSKRAKAYIADWVERRFRLDNQIARDAWVCDAIADIPADSRLLDAGCGSQRYRSACIHLIYTSQDFGQYTVDERGRLGSPDPLVAEPYKYGPIDIVSDIWNIPQPDGSFDAVLCTEVLEHVPYPVETVRELSRLTRPGGKLILTVPSNALRHQDPYFFTSGFSDRWVERILPEHGFVIEELLALEDYYAWMKVQIARTAGVHGWFAVFALAPAFFYFASRRPTTESRMTMTMGYMVKARKL